MHKTKEWCAVATDRWGLYHAGEIISYHVSEKAAIASAKYHPKMPWNLVAIRHITEDWEGKKRNIQ